MSDLVASVFRLTNDRYVMVPKLDFGYLEEDTGVRWHISAGGSRAYLLRYGANLAKREPASIEKQNSDSHFMVQRLVATLLLGGRGLFQAEPAGRLFFESVVQERVSWFTQLNLPTSKEDGDVTSVYDWIGALSRHTILRRAAADAHSALTHPHEAGTFVYRGFEWLVLGEGRAWEDLAADIGVSKADVRDFKKLVNVDYGVRHASRSGVKLRADIDNYGTWVCALIDAVNATRSRLEPGYAVAPPDTVAAAVVQAMPVDPYP